MKLLGLWPGPTNLGATTNTSQQPRPREEIIISSLGAWTITSTNKQRLFVRFNYWHVLDLPIDPLETGLCADRCAEDYHTYALAAGYTYT